MKVVFSNQSQWDANWKMEIDLEEICKLEGKKEDIFKGNGHGYTRKKVYPKSKVRKLFKLTIQNIYDVSGLDEIQDYLECHSKEYGKLFGELRQVRQGCYIKVI